MHEVASSEQASYTLGFYAEGVPDGKYHRLAVRVKISGVSLRYRPGYWAFAEEPYRETSVTSDLKRTMISPFLAEALPMRATPVFEGNPPEKLQITLYISTAKLTIHHEQRRETASLDLIFGQKDATGRTFAIPPYRVAPALTSTEPAQDGWVAVKTRLSLRASTRIVRVVACDAQSGVMGSLDIDIPKPAAP